MNNVSNLKKTSPLRTVLGCDVSRQQQMTFRAHGTPITRIQSSQTDASRSSTATRRPDAGRCGRTATLV